MGGIYVGVAGFSGVGKSTATSYLKAASSGKRFYLGKYVLREVRRRGLAETRENERVVRVEMRAADPAAIAKLAAAGITRALKGGFPVFIDSVMSPAEAEFFAGLSMAAPFRVIALESPMALRIARLSTRGKRPFDQEELAKRDDTEISTLNLHEVLAEANFAMTNQYSRSRFKSQLDSLLSSLR